MYGGAALAVSLFTHFPPALVAWFRVAGAGVILTLIYRPPAAAWRGTRLKKAAAFGCATLAMNCCFYECIAAIPLGTAVTLEFIGPILVAAFSSRTWRDWLALAATAGGVVLLAGPELSGKLVGILWALGSAACWILYIIFGKKIASTKAESTAALAIGFLLAAAIAAVPALLSFPAHLPLAAPQLAGLICALSIFSTVIPYSLEQAVMRRVSAGYYAILAALMPVVSVGIGFILLGQKLSVLELVGVAAVICAVLLKSK